MELKQLRVLRAIAETGSFVEAAERLGLTQPALSHQIRYLEQELDETLLVRARPKVYPTPAGQAVLEASRTIFAEIDALEARFVRSKRSPVSGTLRVAATNMTITYFLGDIFRDFMSKYPEIDLLIRATETTEEAVRRVIVGTSDVAFTPLATLKDETQLSRIAVGTTEHAFIAARNHPLAELSTVSVDDLRKYPFILFQPGSGTRTITDEMFLNSGGYPRILTESNDAQFIIRTVELRLAVALLPVFALQGEDCANKLALLQFTGGTLPVELGCVHRTNLRMNAVEMFKSVCLGANPSHKARFSIKTIWSGRQAV